MITTTRENHYVLNKVVGKVTIKELVDYAQNNFNIWVSDPVLWDMSGGRISEEESDYSSVKNIVANIHTMAEMRKGKKTAFFAPDPFSYGMLRMALGIVECFESRMVASVFKEIDAAKEWVMESGDGN
jgi:hypothetical protein